MMMNRGANQRVLYTTVRCRKRVFFGFLPSRRFNLFIPPSLIEQLRYLGPDKSLIGFYAAALSLATAAAVATAARSNLN